MDQIEEIVIDYRNLHDKVNKVYIPLLKDRNRYVIIYGSAGSGKSVFAFQKLLMRICKEGDHKFLVIRKTARSIRESSFAECIRQIVAFGLSDYADINISNYTINFPLFGSQIVFFGAVEPDRLKSISGITGILIDEMNELTEDDFDIIDTRLRGKSKNYFQIIGLLNPVSEDLWIKRRWVDGQKVDNLTLLKTTYLDNAWIDEGYKQVLESYKFTNPSFYQIYCLGEWGITDKTNSFFYSFHKDKHISTDPLLPNKMVGLWISIDYNVDPFSILIGERINLFKFNVIDEIKLPNSNIYEACHELKKRYPDYRFLVTGDAAGHSRNVALKGNASYWRVVKNELKLNDSQIYVRSRNLPLKESRLLCNTVLEVADVKIDPRCKTLINEVLFAKTDFEGVLIKDRDKNKNDMLDAFRYMLDASFHDILKNPKRYLHEQKKIK